MVEALSSKIIAWENEQGIEFTYDGIRLLSMLEEYCILREEKEQERRRQRDQKKLQGQLIAEKEARFGSKPSPCKPQSAKKMPRVSTGGSNRRLSLGGGAIMQPPPKPTCSAKKADDHAVLSHASRGLDVAGLPVKKLSFNPPSTREVDTIRTPFAPLTHTNNIPSTPSQSNIPTIPHQQNFTPIPSLLSETQENSTPVKAVPAPIPKTPMSASKPMNVATTPAVKTLDMMAMTEYSFEERRFAYYLSRQNDDSTQIV